MPVNFVFEHLLVTQYNGPGCQLFDNSGEVRTFKVQKMLQFAILPDLHLPVAPFVIGRIREAGSGLRTFITNGADGPTGAFSSDSIRFRGSASLVANPEGA